MGGFKNKYKGKHQGETAIPTKIYTSYTDLHEFLVAPILFLNEIFTFSSYNK